jgi:ubiquinone/menaquinone biosynthesis C-methylase UbiE
MLPKQKPDPLGRHQQSGQDQARYASLCRWFAHLLALLTILVASKPVAAQLAAKPAEQWIKTLDSPNRVARLKIDETVTKLSIKAGDIVADIGAGSGLFSFPLAKAVSPGGKVYAVDIEQGLLQHIAVRAQELKLTSVQTVLGEYSDPRLPATNVNLALINDVLHHIEHRAEYIRHLAGYLAPSGRIAVIDFYPELGPHKNEPALQVTKAQAAAWLADAGFSPTAEFELFTDKWFVVYSRKTQPTSQQK